MDIKTEYLYYELVNEFPNEPTVFIKTVLLYDGPVEDENRQVVGNLQATVSFFEIYSIPIYLVISTPKGTICYNYARVEYLPIATNSTYSAGYNNAIVEREYIGDSQTNRRLIITYTD